MSEPGSHARVEPGNREHRQGFLGLAAGLTLSALVVVLVPAVSSAFWLAAVTSAVIYIPPIVGTGILYGRLGVVSLCQVALFAVGAWVALRVGFATSLPFEVVILLAGVVTAVIGFGLGLATSRLRGLYFALVSLMAAGAVQVFLVAKGFPNGGSGFFGVTDGLQAQQVLSRPSYAGSDSAYLRYCVLVVVVLLVLCSAALRTRSGRAWALMREGDECAQSAGINVSRYRLWGVVLTSFVTGAGGALLAGQVGVLNASSFYASDSVVLFAVALLGGAYAISGAVVAAAAYQLLPAALNQLSVTGNASLVIFGVGLLAVLAAAPQGVVGLADTARSLRRPGSERVRA